MKEAIRRKVLEIGFDLCGFATAAPPRTASEFKQWIASGQHGEMNYLARNSDKRLDPAIILPGVKSVVVVALNYTPSLSDPSPLSSSPRGQVARYAQYSDYHNLMGKKLAELSHWMEAGFGSSARSLWYVDTGPILEREFAERAGIGFVGKHTNLISRRLGNWIFLGEILTPLDLEPDLPESNRCGSCVRCINACPTGALTAPFQLDARRCISYLTIELKGPIPLEWRRAMGNRIYGCDDCLAACPWNRFAKVAEGWLAEQRRPELDQPFLLDLLSLSPEQFRTRFADSPILRTKRRGLLRNVAVALGNVGDAEALPALQKAASDPEPLIAEHATWAVAEIERRMTQGS